MQVSVESPSAIERKVTISVGEDKIDEAVQKKLQSLSKSVKMNGFRKGKVPLHVVKQQYGNSVRYEVLQDVINSSFSEAIAQENLKPAGMPDIEPKPSNPGEGLEYTATFEVYPEVSLADASTLSIEKPKAEIADEDMDKMMKTIQKQHMTWEEVDRAVDKGDKVKIDFVGTMDGVAFEGGTSQDHELEIGSGKFIAGFEDGVIGMKPGEQKDLELTFPEHYQKEELAGKPVTFAVTLKSVQAPVLPEIDAELAKKMGVEDGDLDKFKEEIRNNMQRELDNALNSKTKQAVMDALLEAHDVEVPKALVEQEAQALANQMAQQFAQQGMSAKDLKLGTEMFEGEAKRRVTLGLIMAEIVKQQDIKADEALVKQKIEQIAEPYEQSEQVIQWYYGDQRRLAEVESIVIEEQIVDSILSKAKTTDKSMTFNEVMYPNSQK